MKATELLSHYIRDRGFSLKAISNATKIPTTILYPSLAKKPRRSLRADEFLSICVYLQIEPMQFYCPEEKDNLAC